MSGECVFEEALLVVGFSREGAPRLSVITCGGGAETVLGLLVELALPLELAPSLCGGFLNTLASFLVGVPTVKSSLKSARWEDCCLRKLNALRLCCLVGLESTWSLGVLPCKALKNL